MSTHPQTATRRRAGAARAPGRRAPARRAAPPARARASARRCWSAMAIVLAWPQFHHAVREITLPLRHEDIIRQQAHDKGLDPALIAAVIYAESHFRDGQTSRRRRAGPHAAHAGHRALHRAQVGRHAVRGRRPRHAPGQHRLRRLLPALPAAPLRRQPDLRAGGLQRRRGQRRPLDRRGAGARPRDDDHRDPVRRDARLCRSACSRCAGSTAARTPSSSAGSAASPATLWR